MQRMFLSLLTAAAAVVLLQVVTAEEGKRPEAPRPEMKRERPTPEVMFKRLDANHDGVITPDEIPAGMPEPVKQMLLRAVKSHDGKLTQAQLAEAIKQHRPGPRPEGGPMPPPWGWRADGKSFSPPHREWYSAGGRSWHAEGGQRDFGYRPWHSEGGPHAFGYGSWGPDGRGHGFAGHHKCCCHKGHHKHGDTGHHKCCHKGHHKHGDAGHHKCCCHKGHHKHGDASHHKCCHKSHHKHGESMKACHDQSMTCPAAKSCPTAKKPQEVKKSEVKQPAGKKSEVKHPKAKGPDGKAMIETEAIEARLTALEKEKAAALVALKQVEESTKAKLAVVDQQRGEILAMLQKVKAEQKTKELAQAEKKPEGKKKD
jgi:hypothetical protein